uniref:NADH dehydrogenase subunit 6 n=1 Tax=Semelidae sp. STW-2017 TaxID=1969324 RepID=A0A1U9XPD3_9BIVA|nr:NADH dehydrogenase subunit 6 [Semelidae sp. STW-2017]
MSLLVFWSSYMMLVLSMFLWLAKHPLSVGGGILLLYMAGSALVSLVVSFVVGIFLFLTGVSGMMVAFLYVVALCPNPIFDVSKESLSLKNFICVVILIVIFMPIIFMWFSVSNGNNPNNGVTSDNYQWLNDPSMFGGLAELMPFLGLLLFLCMVSVVVLCGRQKQCLGGHSFSNNKRAYL